MKEITIKLPIKVVEEILRRVPREELGKIERRKHTIKSVPVRKLTKLIGIASLGGDALKDTEKIWDE